MRNVCSWLTWFSAVTAAGTVAFAPTPLLFIAGINVSLFALALVMALSD
jgi:hypothetical protein